MPEQSPRCAIVVVREVRSQMPEPLSDRPSEDLLRNLIGRLAKAKLKLIRQALLQHFSLKNTRQTWPATFPEALGPADTWLVIVGSKRLLARQILQRFPHHTLFAEVFGGGANLVLQKPFDPAISEVYNDLNRELANLFWVIQNQFGDFYAKLFWSVRARAIWEEWKQIEASSLDRVTRAVRYFYLLRTSFSGKQDFASFAVNYDRQNRKILVPPLSALYKVHHRFQRVLIEALSYEEFIPRYDRPGVLFYLDPPYEVTATDSSYYAYSWPLPEHGKLRKVLEDVKGKWLLSYNDSPRIRQLYADFIIEQLPTSYSVGSPRGSRKSVFELLIRNYDLQKQGELDKFLD
ncbi:MAG: DNA adenine methylase [Candidatus Heimdallarchaeota archaeon]